jgi:NAD(P)-dependent dehydrogenase (short-subunit alcohol dehydrogenase family)
VGRVIDRQFLTKRRVVVVGATGAIGSAIVDELVAQEASVLATGRDPERLELLRDRALGVMRAELGDPAAPTRVAEQAARNFDGTLDGLVIATGDLKPIGPTRSLDLELVARTLQSQVIGALGTVQACAELLDAGSEPSVVLFSGGGASAAFPRYTAYALAKTAIVRLAENLAAEEPTWKVNAVAPGFVASEIHAETLAAGPEVAGPYYEETRTRLAEAVPATRAAALVAFLLSSGSRGITGRLISAVWDDWEDAAFQQRLRTDRSLARLRRIDGQLFVEASSRDG